MGARSEAAGYGDARERPDCAAARRRRLSVDRRRDELMAAALELFGARDPDDISIDDVAAAAGASRALVYHYFGGKRELHVAALRRAAAGLERRPPPMDGGCPLDALAGALARYFDFAEEHAAGFAALLRGGGAGRGGEVGRIVEGVRGELFASLTRRLPVREPGALLRVTLGAWIATVESAALDWLEHRDVERRALERLLVDQMVATLTAAARHDPEASHVLHNLKNDR
ncbi:TetR/AcrR family transcriptional regulator [Spongiactinospora rosea]|nr:TetR/AcrR family transcriptional regulator [Spongiactinospora rosea]